MNKNGFGFSVLQFLTGRKDWSGQELNLTQINLFAFLVRVKTGFIGSDKKPNKNLSVCCLITGMYFFIVGFHIISLKERPLT